MIQSPPRRSPNPVVTVLIGFAAGFVAEFSMDLFLDYVLKPSSQSQLNLIIIVLSIVLGAVVGGVMLLGRPGHYGLAVIAGAAAVVAGFIGDEVSTLVYFLIEDLPLHVSTFTGYFTHARPIFWISNLIVFVTAAGLTALRVLRVRAAGGRPQQQGWAPSYGPAPAPYGPPPQGPYGPAPQGPYGQQQYGPTGPQPQGPYGPPQGPYPQPGQYPQQYGPPSPPPHERPDEPPAQGPYRPPT